MKRFNLELSEKASQLLEELAKKTGKTKADILRTGLGLLKYAEDAKDQDKSLAVVSGDNIEKEILVP